MVVLDVYTASADTEMSNKVAWSQIHTRITGYEADRVLDNIRKTKTLRITGSNIVSCQTCSDSTPHPMRYQIYDCASQACAAVTTDAAPCPWRAKVLRCQSSDLVSIYTTRKHLVEGADQPNGRMTKAQKDLASSLAAHGLKTQQIMNRFAADTDGKEMPSLRKLQQYVTYYRRARMHNTDDLDAIEQQIQNGAYRGDENEEQAFFFSIHQTADGKIYVGTGTDNDPFIIGVTTKGLLRRFDRDVGTFIFHLDTTFKTNLAGYPVMVCGISDSARTFHLTAIFVMSQRQTTHRKSVLASLRYIYTRVTDKQLQLRYVMGDADDAQYNAVSEVFAGSNTEYLMCYFHVVKKLSEFSKSVPPQKMSLVYADIYDMHVAKTDSAFVSRKAAAVMRWRADPEVSSFGEYIYQQWLTGKFRKWQCRYTPIGFASTNNPVETFNDKLKTRYTTRQQLKMGLLLLKLSETCKNEHVLGRAFQTDPVANNKLKKRAVELRRGGFLTEVPRIDFGELQEEDAVDDPFIIVMAQPVPRVRVDETEAPVSVGGGTSAKKTQKKKNKRTVSVEVLAATEQLNVNNARIERDGMPDGGWLVNVDLRKCPCKYFFKYGHCVHLLFALYMRYGSDNPPKRALFNRNPRYKKRSFEEMVEEAVQATREARGRPILNGPALSLE